MQFKIYIYYCGCHISQMCWRRRRVSSIFLQPDWCSTLHRFASYKHWFYRCIRVLLMPKLNGHNGHPLHSPLCSYCGTPVKASCTLIETTKPTMMWDVLFKTNMPDKIIESVPDSVSEWLPRHWTLLWCGVWDCIYTDFIICAWD